MTMTRCVFSWPYNQAWRLNVVSQLRSLQLIVSSERLAVTHARNCSIVVPIANKVLSALGWLAVFLMAATAPHVEISIICPSYREIYINYIGENDISIINRRCPGVAAEIYSESYILNKNV